MKTKIKVGTLHIIIAFVLPIFALAESAQSMLWKVTGGDLAGPSYVFGTIHLICEDDLDIGGKIESALAESKQVVLELDMDEPGFMQALQQLSINAGQENLSSKLTEGEQQQLSAFFSKHYGADLTQLGVLRPVALLSMIFMKGLECAQPGSYEFSLIAAAKDKGLPVHGLESPEEQFAILDKVPLENRIEWLLHYTGDEAALRSEVAGMVDAYLAEDPEDLLDLMLTDPRYEEVGEALIFDRNENWIAPMLEWAREMPTFFAVGAAHLSGERGVLELLRKAGYKVTPVMD
jgi:uncharacterized protein YbaP (TraB family)